MAGQESYQDYEQQQGFYDINTHIQDIEERQKLTRERVLMMGKNLIDEKEKVISELKELKKEMIIIKEENNKMKEILSNLTRQINKTVRKEELMTLQRQFDLMRDPNK